MEVKIGAFRGEFRPGLILGDSEDRQPESGEIPEFYAL